MVHDKIEKLLNEMTLEEKVSMAAGSTMWHSTPVERLGIPRFKVSDGPNGARGGDFQGGATSACFPVGIALASSWNPELVQQIGVALAEEVKAKGAHVLLAPTVNIHRSPLNGRNFECYSEDPYLTGRLAIAYINGVQSQNIGTSIKHFVCNDSEFERNTISSEITERPLREIYLRPFEMAVKEAKPWSVMSSYNKINGTYAAENEYTLTDILKKEWGFDGFVVSDWFGTKSTAASANAGLDLEMPGPAQWMGDKLLQAVKDGEVPESAIDDKVRRLLNVIIRSGLFEDSTEKPEQAIDRPEHRQLIRKAASEGIVLLKNEGNILPLMPKKVKTLAIIGPNAAEARVMGGGSARVNMHYNVTPMQGITSRAGDTMELGYELGCTNHKALPLIKTDWLASAKGEPGLTVEYFNGYDPKGDPALVKTVTGTEFMWFGGVSPEVDPNIFSACVTGTFTPTQSGEFTFGLVSAGMSRLYLNDEPLIDNWDDYTPGGDVLDVGAGERKAGIVLVAGQPVRLRVEYSSKGASIFRVLRLGCLPPIPADAMERAAKLAADADVALVFVGTSDEWESEGYDRPDMELPGEQVALIEKVAAANKNTVVVLNTGSPISMNWLDKVAGVVQAWFPGQEAGNAIADVLFGDVTPSGKLPQTTPFRLEDNPAFINYPGENGKVHYGEGLFVGYRYYEKKDIAPRFPFGFGLSYTTFAYANAVVSAAEFEYGDSISVSVDVTNTGDRAGQEIVQLYVKDVKSSLVRPHKELKGFAKVALAPGETKTVTIPLDMRSLAFFDPQRKGWVVEAGDFEALIGASSVDIRATVPFSLKTGSVEKVVTESETKFGLDSTLRDLLDNEAAKAVLMKYAGEEMMGASQMEMAMSFTLAQLAGFAPDMLPEAKLKAIAADLAAL